ALLRARERETQARLWVFYLALALALIVPGSAMGYYIVRHYQKRRLAEAANVAKSRFLAAASHDLRQPMHALNLYLGTLAGLALPGAARALLPMRASVRRRWTRCSMGCWRCRGWTRER